MMDKKTFFIIVLALAILTSTLMTGCTSKQNNNSNNNDNNDIASEAKDYINLADQTIDGVDIKDIRITFGKENNKIVATVINKNKIDYPIRSIIIKLFDKNDKLIHETFGFIGSTLKRDESKVITTYVTVSLETASKATFEIVKL